MSKNIVKLDTYKKKQRWQTIVEYFKYGFNGKLGNLVDFNSFKIEKFIKKYGNDRRIVIIMIAITVIICLYIWFL